MTAFEKHLTRQATRPTPAQESASERIARIEREREEREYQSAVRDSMARREAGR